MKKCNIAYLACSAAVLVTGIGAAPPVSGHTTRVVHPGQSIQKAVDASKPGDTVVVAPGTYRESVKITTPGLTLRGVGRRTVIEPSIQQTPSAEKPSVQKPSAEKPSAEKPGAEKPGAAKPSVQKPSVQKPGAEKPSAEKPSVQKPSVQKPGAEKPGAEKPSVQKPSAAKPDSRKKAPNSCAEAGNGICVEGTKDRRLEGVTVASLVVTGFAKTGLSATSTDGLTVRNVTAVKNGVWGIAQEHSVHGTFRGNTARDNGDAGLFLANTVKAEEGALDTDGTVVERNRLEGNRIGVTVRRLRNVTVNHNYFTGNCAGVFLVGDENKPRAGALTVADNRIERNNKSCPKTARLDAIQGAGIVLTGVEDTVVTHNLIRDHAGTSPFSGGIVLYKSVVGTPSERNRIQENTLSGNSPADLVDADTGKNNTFAGNTCRASKPTGLC